MHQVLFDYFALVDAIEDAFRSGEPHNGVIPWENQWHCPPCHSPEGWAEKLGEVLKEHGLDLEAFAEEDEGFSVVDGQLQFSHPGGAGCMSVRWILRAAAEQLGPTRAH